MSTANAVNRYLKRVRRIKTQTRARRRGELPLLELTWNMPALDQGGQTHWLEVSWEPWMGRIGYVMVLLDCLEDAAHGEPRGKSLEALNRELGDLLCAGPEGNGYIPRLMKDVIHVDG